MYGNNIFVSISFFLQTFVRSLEKVVLHSVLKAFNVSLSEKEFL